ncbi:flagellar basal body rod protein FlgB [Trichlorobacter ammonificans]|uniref:Flagellar basal body rod protein FlgB n=1 Tax=Trichlorobacter ammonificans TaxID=2916410 RepID=A0ABM9D6F1_9BACT|nr:flagellar basal body rod protein FlgB [Trichlorobacter ammonificans]CAH2029983.1 Flagellar basal body rod protein FlgB [Trichlorobacter ammonificans]
MPVEGLFSTTIDVLSKSVDLRTRAHNLTASNIANAETPGYTPKALQFEESLQQAVKKSTKRGGGTPSTTHPAHIPLKRTGDSIQQVRGDVVEVPAKTPGRDGNSVELENEMSRMMQNQVLFNASAQLLTKKFEGLRSALREGK